MTDPTGQPQRQPMIFSQLFMHVHLQSSDLLAHFLMSTTPGLCELPKGKTSEHSFVPGMKLATKARLGRVSHPNKTIAPRVTCRYLQILLK